MEDRRTFLSELLKIDAVEERVRGSLRTAGDHEAVDFAPVVIADDAGREWSLSLRAVRFNEPRDP